LKCFVEKRNSYEDAGQHYFFIVEAVFRNVAVQVEDTTMKLLFGNTLVSSFNGKTDLVLIRVKAFFKFAITSHY